MQTSEVDREEFIKGFALFDAIGGDFPVGNR